MTTDAARPDARRNDPRGTRERLIDTAYAAFVGNGYHATSMHDLKREAGVSGGALAHHFPTKKDLGLSVLRDRVTRAVEETWIAPLQAASGAREGILSIFGEIAVELEGRGSVTGCPLNNLSYDMARQDPDFRDEIELTFRRWRDAIARKIRDRQGALNEVDPDAFAVLVVAAYSGAMAMARASQTAAPLKACASQLERIMIDWDII
ncbi:TetR family transcriptional regulator [Sinorhizobium meliloti]|uniref:TetR/AcrR family transcriptional regulator n=1 Tax=Rhizobium meliloti TaxID=382 RepID=UPI000FDC7212|nr:TetR/AcrR family transcriptional regulator [Sinorhizobium meliloti]MDW9540009.1 TetR family transcriptional regulator [Sinorhizobium meliloti]MDW9545903.1 TetR family transcriptional regulator [Sinorhizobium meliloti]MDW9596039.1 TetR family transcriptional regulator [Sinorhizobium meliloti]MDX0191487.1 TetR family transcriptional regulator [Sinorhizobium meliloti]MQV10757.1 TetR family transcriptional regulator [Sinorhizobium meliloti]